MSIILGIEIVESGFESEIFWQKVLRARLTQRLLQLCMCMRVCMRVCMCMRVILCVCMRRHFTYNFNCAVIKTNYALLQTPTSTCVRV